MGCKSNRATYTFSPQRYASVGRIDRDSIGGLAQTWQFTRRDWGPSYDNRDG